MLDGPPHAKTPIHHANYIEIAMSSTCPNEQQLSSLLDESLDPDHREQIDEHIETCTECQEKLEVLLVSTHDSVAPETDVVTSDDKISDLIHRLQSTPAPKTKTAKVLGHELPFRVGRYEMQKEIGRGGTGRLYLAHDSQLDRQVAVKVLHEHLDDTKAGRDRFLREAKSVATLKHPGIVTIFDVLSSEESPLCLVLELVKGESLSNRLKREETIDAKTAAQFAREVAIALQAAHETGIIHRDVKPSNILIDAKTHAARLTDFGLARSDDVDNRLTIEGQLAGTPAYMSPEQVLQADHIDRSTDIYSLGVVLYEMLTGTIPFRGVVRMTLSQILHDDPTPVLQLNDKTPKDLANICEKAMSKEASRRYPTAVEFAEDLQRFLTGEPVHARPVGRLSRGWRLAKRYPRTSILATTLACVLLFVAIGSSVAAIFIADSRDEANSSRQLAEKAAAKANRQRNETLQILKDLTDKVQSEFNRTVIDFDETEMRLLGTIRSKLESLTNDPNWSIDNDFFSAEAHFVLGQIFYRVDELDRASKEQQLAGEFIEAEIKKDSQNDEAYVLRAKISDWQAHLATERGDYEKSIKLGNDAIESLKKVKQTDDFQLEVDETLSQIHDTLGTAHEFQGNLETAIQHYRQNTDLLKRLVSMKKQGRDEMEVELIDNTLYLADLYDEEEQSEKSVPLYVELIEHCDRYLKTHTDDLYVQSILRDCHIQLSKDSIDDLSVRLKHLGTAIKLGDLVLDEFADNDIVWSQANLHIRLAKLNSSNGGSASDVQESLKVAEELLNALLDSDEPPMPEYVGLGFFEFAEAKREIEGPAKIDNYYRLAVRYLKIAAQEDPENPNIETPIRIASERINLLDESED